MSARIYRNLKAEQYNYCSAFLFAISRGLFSWLVILGSWLRFVFTKVCEGRAVQDRPYIFYLVSDDFFSWLVILGSWLLILGS